MTGERRSRFVGRAVLVMRRKEMLLADSVGGTDALAFRAVTRAGDNRSGICANTTYGPRVSAQDSIRPSLPGVIRPFLLSEVGVGEAVGMAGRPLHQLDAIAVGISEPRCRRAIRRLVVFQRPGP